MHDYVAIVFPTEAQARLGFDALGKLNHADEVDIHGAALIHRSEAGEVRIEEKRAFPIGLRTVIGAAAGLILGMLAGPAGAASGAYAGAVAGLGADAVKGGEQLEATDELKGALRPGQSAIVAEVSKDNSALLEPAMGKYGGRIFRRSASDMRAAFFDPGD